MSDTYSDVIRRLATQGEPVPTEREPVLPRLEGIRAVMFDVYGTLFLGESDAVSSESERREAAFVDSLAAVGVAFTGKPAEGLAALDSSIDEARAALRERGVEHPEIDIVAMWRSALDRLVQAGTVEAIPEGFDFNRLTIEFEARANPVWPAPGLEACLDRLHDAGIAIGLVSNAQFYTEELFPALVSRTLDDLGVPADMRCLSYRHARAKPGRHLFEQAAAILRKRGIKAEEVLFVGNDMLNDVKPASEIGFRTAIFAGDARTFAPHEKDKKLKKLAPDAVITELAQVPECVLPS